MSAAVGVCGWLLAAAAVARWHRRRQELGALREAVADAAHELRGPLGALRLAIGAGAGGGALPPSGAPEGSGRVHGRPAPDCGGGEPRGWSAIEAEFERAALAVADLDSAAEGRPPHVRTALVDLGALLADSVEAWRPSATRAGVELLAAGASAQGRLALVPGDPRRLAQATGNLIANAIEHGGERVRVSGAAWEGGARIEVADDGGGLPAEVITLAARRRRREGRRGRGLAIAAGIAIAHRGTLAVRPLRPGAPRPGTAMVLEWPVAPAPDQSRTLPAEHDASGPGGPGPEPARPAA